MLSKEPVRIRHDWNVAVVGYCDFCSHSKMTVPHADGGRICASCCDSEFLSSWQNYARSLATEVLSLREQLAELKALPPVAWNTEDHGTDKSATTYDPGVAERWKYKGWTVTELFTAAKPSGDSEIAKFMAGVKNSMVKEVAEAIQKEALLIMFDEITPDTETVAMQYESLVKRINCPED
ncbi:hypothetical protein [Yersinia proxima]|uniref:hypothetical protein n=1 Tax=Yersinia proxima TaxID=2890316 RepID=UPI001D11986E|nr:hypothetical protein [Yersinia proxima]